MLKPYTNTTIKTENHQPTLLLLAKYTLIFIILTLGVFAVFILAHKVFIHYGDAYKQGYFWTVELRNNLKSLAAGEGYPLWSWYKGLGMEVSLPTDPFQVVAALFPPGYIEFGYTFAILLRMYCSGLAFIALGREMEMTDLGCLVGGFGYAYSGWIVNMALAQGSFLNATTVLPILILSVDRIYKKKSPLIFIFTVAYFLICSPYTAYMAAIATVIYIFLRYAAYNDYFKLSEYLKQIGVFIVYGLIGICISAVTLLPMILTLRGASLDSVTDGVDLFFVRDVYEAIGSRITGVGKMEGYSYLGVPALAFVTLAVSLRKISIRNTPVIMTIMFFIMALFPFFGSMFNGFGYVVGRWYFLWTFFFIWAAAESFDVELLQERGNVIAMLIAWAIIFAWTVGEQLVGITHLPLRRFAFILVQVTAALLMIAVIAIRSRRGYRRKWEKDRAIKIRERLIVFISIAAIILTWNCSLYHNTDPYITNNKLNKQLKHSTQRAGALIEDDGFYRVDMVDGLDNHEQQMKPPANETLWWQYQTVYLYDSKLPSRWQKFYQTVGNNYGYSKRVFVKSNNIRMGLDFLCGVKYFLGNDHVTDREYANAYAGYGFEYEDTLDGVDILKSKYDTGLGFVYDKYMPESEFLKLTRLEREQALLQAAVIPNEELKELRETVLLDEPGAENMQVRASDIETDIKDVPFEIVDTDGVDVSKFKKGSFKVKKKEGSITIKTKSVKDAQLMLSFDHLYRKKWDGNSKPFDMHIDTGTIVNETMNESNKNQTLAGISDYDLNMGYYDKEKKGLNITISFSKKGKYYFDRMYMSAMSTEIFDKYAAQRQKNKFSISQFNSKIVSGKTESEKDGIVFFSVPKYDNWDVYIDGEKAERIEDLNVAFMGAKVPAGKHQVELRYNFGNLKKGALVSLFGLILAIIAGFVHLRRRMY